VVAPLTVLSPGPGLAGTPSRGNGNEGLKRLSRFRGSGVCRQPVPPGMPVVGAQVAADGSRWQFLGKSPPPSRPARRHRPRNLGLAAFRPRSFATPAGRRALPGGLVIASGRASAPAHVGKASGPDRSVIGPYPMQPSVDLFPGWISRRRRRSQLGTIHLIDLTTRVCEIDEMYGREKR
jgi:hypothetical protein